MLLNELEKRLKAQWVTVPPAVVFGAVAPARNSREAADAAADVLEKVEAWLNLVLNPDTPSSLHLFTELFQSYDRVFEATDTEGFRTIRFDRAKNLLKDESKKEFLTCAKKYCPEIKRRALDALDVAVRTTSAATSIASDVTTMMIYRCVRPALGVMSKLKGDAAWLAKNGADLLRESDTDQAARVKAIAVLEDLSSSIEVITNIEARVAATTSLAPIAGGSGHSGGGLVPPGK